MSAVGWLVATTLAAADRKSEIASIPLFVRRPLRRGNWSPFGIHTLYSSATFHYANRLKLVWERAVITYPAPRGRDNGE